MAAQPRLSSVNVAFFGHNLSSGGAVTALPLGPTERCGPADGVHIVAVSDEEQICASQFD
jgi:hypothetical protein